MVTVKNTGINNLKYLFTAEEISNDESLVLKYF